MNILKKTTMIIIAIILVISSFYGQYFGLKREMQSTAQAKEAFINRYIDLSKGFIDMVAIYSNDFFQHNRINDSALYNRLEYNNGTYTYNLDIIGGTKDQETAGNLTGMGSIPDTGVYRDEINLALELNQQFSSIYNKLPDIAWLYYTSNNNFINIYPWVSSTDFVFKEDLKAEKFFTYVTPEKNPSRESVWTPVYLDHAGKGLMVTLSSPVYCCDDFMGAVSLDITNIQLSEMIRSDYEIYIIDETDSVLANSMNFKYDKDVPKLNALLNTSLDNVEEMKKMEPGILERSGNYYIYSACMNNAPWRMFVRIPVMLVIGKAALITFPILVICMLLLFMVFEVEKRKSTEAQLRTSLEEITSFHTLLDNAAKYDFLTSTVNRRGLEEIFNNNIKPHSTTTQVPVGIIIGDIDFFKEINDTFGHSAGDKVLIEFANLMKKNKGPNDVVCRWGGEEFVIVLVNKTYDQVMQFAENLRKQIESTVISWNDATELGATMTLGVAEYQADTTLESTISQADVALYAGKRNGRNQVVGYLDVKQTSHHYNENEL